MRGVFAFAMMMTASLPALAGGVSVVVPNRPDVPIIINGVDARWAVVEGDWGLARGVHVQPTIYGGAPVDPVDVGRYFPSAGKAPGYGRLEIEPPRRARRAQSYYRSWTAQSEPSRPPELAASPPLMIDTQISPNAADGLPMRRRR